MSVTMIRDDDSDKEKVVAKGNYGYTKQARVVLLDYKSPVDEMALYVKFDETLMQEVVAKFPIGKLIQLKNVRRKLVILFRAKFFRAWS
jgi:hypothetical protein